VIYAAHSLHVPACIINERGQSTHDGTYWFALPEPLFTAETREEAEAMRAERLATCIKETPDAG
jgi:predicted RNase H-like HicB family nuclease